jgi:hypothetical protein
LRPGIPMSGEINKLRELGRRWGIMGGSKSSRATGSDLPLDHQLTFRPHHDEKWSYEENRIFLDDVDVREIVGEGANDVAVLCGVSQGLCEYQQHVWGKGGKAFAKFNGTVSSLQDTIAGRLGSIYEDMTGGVRFECHGDDFWVNNVNVRSVLSLYRLKPTEKARCYLLGLKDKLGLILSRQQSSTRYDGVRDRARQLFLEIDAALEFVPADAPLRLCSGQRSA